eukprot:4717242-Amphidinium_carterae.1
MNAGIVDDKQAKSRASLLRRPGEPVQVATLLLAKPQGGFPLASVQHNRGPGSTGFLGESATD